MDFYKHLIGYAGYAGNTLIKKTPKVRQVVVEAGIIHDHK